MRPVPGVPDPGSVLAARPVVVTVEGGAVTRVPDVDGRLARGTDGVAVLVVDGGLRLRIRVFTLATPAGAATAVLETVGRDGAALSVDAGTARLPFPTFTAATTSSATAPAPIQYGLRLRCGAGRGGAPERAGGGGLGAARPGAVGVMTSGSRSSTSSPRLP